MSKSKPKDETLEKIVDKRTPKRSKVDFDEQTRCPECSSTHLIRDYERGELVCEKCGLVIEERFIDQGPEWRVFGPEQTEKSRTGDPLTPLMHDRGLSTDISWKDRDAYGKSFPKATRAQIYRIRKWQRITRITSGTERNLVFALGELDRMSSGMVFQELYEKQQQLFTEKL